MIAGNEVATESAPPRPAPAAVAWHYTTGERFCRIVEVGYIRPAVAGVTKPERPITWFTLSQSWEQTANKCIVSADETIHRLDMQQTYEYFGGLVRIGVLLSTVPHSWDSLRRNSGMSRKIAEALHQTAVEQGSNPDDWRGTFKSVPREKWVAIEVYQDGEWINVPID